MRGLAVSVAFAMVNLTSVPQSSAASPTLESGVSLELAKWRARHYKDLRYAISLTLVAGAPRAEGTLRLSVRMPKRPVDLVLDWRGDTVRDLAVNGKPLEAEAREEHLVIPRKALKPGLNIVTLSFESAVAVSGTPITRYRDREDGSEYVYTLLVPADASALFPCFDQPDLKARFTLELEMPEDWRAVSNAPAEAEAPGKARFAETEPISTYLFAFAAGPFEAITAPGDEVRLFVRRSRTKQAHEHAAEVLRLNRASMKYFASYFSHRFPFAKYDLVLVPEFPYGGMEHAGATFLNEERVLFPAPPSAADLLRRAQLIFHETSHQWFGDLVTMRWFDDLWLKEGFANFMAAKALEALAPEFDAWSAFHALKTNAVRTDATRGTTAIRYPLSNLADAKSAYGAIVYSKGPAVLRQAEFYLGEAAFRRAVRAFVKRHAYGAADWKDLVRAFELASGRKLQRWARAWVERRGMPTVRAHWSLDTRGRLTGLRLEQHDSLGEGGLWPMRLRVVALGEGKPRAAEVLLERLAATVPKLEGMPGPRIVFPNAGDHGYGRFLLDPASAEAALAPDLDLQDTLLQAQLAEALWESVRDAALAPERFIRYLLHRVPRTGDDIALSGMLGRLEVAFRRYLSDAQRDALAAEVERALLQDGALAARAQSRRLILLRAYGELAWSPAGLEALKRLLDDRSSGLASRDRFRFIQRLLVRGDPDAPGRLAAQAAMDRSDNGQRYAYAAGAAAADAGTKRVLFKAFLEDRSLAEGWIEAALAPLNAPEHEALTVPLLAEALARLPELKRGRKIFFVNGWLAAFIGGQSGTRALAEVNAALRNSRLDPDLRLKLLESADGLERAVRIRERYASN
ncbi:MAG: M1 family aminopeptidase [Betaproteobacteria bacterium]